MGFYSVNKSGDINITFSDGTGNSLPDADSWGVGPQFQSFHSYNEYQVVGSTKQGWTVGKAWDSLISQPAPGNLVGVFDFSKI